MKYGPNVSTISSEPSLSDNLSPQDLVELGLNEPLSPWPKVFCSGCLELIWSTEYTDLNEILGLCPFSPLLVVIYITPFAA